MPAHSIKKFVPTALLFLFALVFLISTQGALAGGTMSMKYIADELEMTYEQAKQFMEVCNAFKEKREALVKEATELDPAELDEKKKRLQREYYDDLTKIISKEQILKYQQILRNSETTSLEESAQKYQQSKDSATPYLNTFRAALKHIELSGLQEQALGAFFSEMEEKMAQMFYWDLEFDPSKDQGVLSIFQTRLKWILTDTQYKRLCEIIAQQRDTLRMQSRERELNPVIEDGQEEYQEDYENLPLDN